MAFKLADLFVQFGAKGEDKIAAAAGKVGTVLKTAAATIMAYATAGFVGTAEGERMAFAQKRLAETVSSLVLPVFDSLTKATLRFSEQISSSKAAEKFQGAMGKVGDAMERILEAIGPALNVFIDRMADQILTIAVPALEKLAEWIEKLANSGWLERIANAAAMAMAPLSNIADMIEAGFNVTKFNEIQQAREKRAREGGGNMQRVTPGGGGMESVIASYARIQQAALKHDFDIPKRHLEVAERQLEAQQTTNQLLGQPVPAVTQ